MDMQQPMNDAERAAMNIKFEYERAKRLRAAESVTASINPELQTTLNARAAALQQAAMDAPTPAYIARGEAVPSAGSSVRAQRQSFELDSYRDMQNIAQPQPFSDTAIDRAFDQIEAKAARSPSILKLAMNLTARMLLVIGVAILVLAWVTK